MSLEDRDWYKDDFDRRMGRGKYQEQNREEATRESKRQEQGGTTAKVERVKKYQATAGDERAYNTAPPEHTILAAKYELAIRRRNHSTFWAGVVAGMMIGAVLAEAIRAIV
ncbi:hypothetical protein [Ectopseudomonas khazarica]|uniref:hypothetical protein n=1 Tax=Ectopseudomonas khazarica TaxID=2502979 RepID=UPI003B9248F7